MSSVDGSAAKVQASLESVGMHFHTQGNDSVWGKEFQFTFEQLRKPN